MMELGNMLFGNSRGECHIPRGGGWEDELRKLLKVCAIEFDWGDCNDIQEAHVEDFIIFPYYWGDCTCGFQDLVDEWEGIHEHSQDCYQIEYRKIEESIDITSPDRRKKAKALCVKHNIPWDDGRGCAMHCTCDYEKEWIKFLQEHSHADDCPIIRPNFLYKPTGFQIKWYSIHLGIHT